MKKFVNKLLAAGMTLNLFMLTSCSGSKTTLLYQPTAEMATASNLQLTDLQKGRTLYVASCGGCHDYYAPEKYTKAEWVTNLNKMQSKAKITNEQKSLIYNYLVQMAKP